MEYLICPLRSQSKRHISDSYQIYFHIWMRPESDLRISDSICFLTAYTCMAQLWSVPQERKKTNLATRAMQCKHSLRSCRCVSVFSLYVQTKRLQEKHENDLVTNGSPVWFCDAGDLQVRSGTLQIQRRGHPENSRQCGDLPVPALLHQDHLWRQVSTHLSWPDLFDNQSSHIQSLLLF